MARPERFELPTTKFVAWYSIQLSYGRVELTIMTPLVAVVNALLMISAAEALLPEHAPRPWRDPGPTTGHGTQKTPLARGLLRLPVRPAD